MNITVSELSKYFVVQGKRKALFENLSFSIDVDSVVALLGPSGSGKTTLLRIIAGLEIPEKGSIFIDDKKLVFEERFLENYRKNLGIVFQQQNLFPHYTVIENVMLPLRLVQGKTLEVSRKEAEEVMERLKLTQHYQKKPHQLSGGESQRVAIARSLVTRPQFLLFDEPTSSLDVEMKVEVLDLIAELKELQIPLLLITHEIGFAKKCADQILFMAQGKIIEQGGVESFFLHPKTEPVKQFLKTVFAY